MSAYIIAIDQSTAGTKVLLFDTQGHVVAVSSKQHKQYYPLAGWVEHDANEIYNNVLSCIRELLDKAEVTSQAILGVTITNQRETAVMWDTETGEPLCRAIVWQCQRTSEVCAAMKAAGAELMIKEKTGLMLDPYFSATKWQWMLQHVEAAPIKLAAGKLLAGTIDSWLLWKLTGGAIHATDYSNASRTSLFNIHTLQWDEELCELFNVPVSILPQVNCSDTIFGHTNSIEVLDDGIPITGIIGDSQAALFGNRCFAKGSAKATYGTGTSVLMNIGATKPIHAHTGVVEAIAWGQGGTVTYALEAIIRSSGDSLLWVRDNLGLFTSFDEMEALIQEVDDNEGVYLVPAFVGLGAPYWQPEARAAITGMNRRSNKAHIMLAALESIAYQVCDAVELLQGSAQLAITELQVDGGASRNNRLMQFQADMLGTKVTRYEVAELSAMGSYYMGGLALGIWASLEDIPPITQEFSFEPLMSKDRQERLYRGWKQSVLSVMTANN